MRPVGAGAKCITCSERRRRLLKSVELFGRWQPMCFSCSGQVLSLSPLPATLADLKDAVSRERRCDDRRSGRPDARVFQYERRAGQRRSGRLDEYPLVDDDMIIEVIIDESIDIEFDDPTRIHQLAG
jgi:hypothetical protein